MTTTSTIRIDGDVIDSAKREAATMNRSAAQQVTHWARIGRELEAAASASPRAIASVLSGTTSYDELGTEEQAVVRATWAEALDARITLLDLRRRFLAEGRTFAELDASGEVVKRVPPRT